MQKKKNIRRIIIFIALLIGVVIVFALQRDDSKALVDPELFKVKDLATIDRVELKTAKRLVRLAYDGSRWKINDKFDADRQRITVLFATLEKAVPKRPVAESKKDSIKQRLHNDGVTLSLYAGKDLVKQFIAGGNSQRTEAYFEDAEKQEPYLVTIPGYRVYVSQIFDLGENDWRDKRVFGLNWTDFNSFTAFFPSDAAAGFTIVKNQQVVSLKEDSQADTSRIFSYLDDISYLVGDQILTPGTSNRYDSLAKTPAIARLEVTDVAHRTFTLELFQPMKGDEMALGRTPEHGLLLIDRKRVYRVVRKRAYFKKTAA